ncbi:hypothetical protein N9118_12125 [Akkermansiaceae bacterium]|nr:hypothetical protein [Akkermansiaceae bacterium]
MKIPIFILISALFVACAPADKKKTSAPVKSTVKPSASAATKSTTIAKTKPTTQTATKVAPQKKSVPPVITTEETTSTQKILETVPFAAPDSDFKNR